MKTLVDVDFRVGGFPADWMEETSCASFNDGVMQSGPATVVQFVLPGSGWERMRIEIQASVSGKGRIDYSDGTLTLSIDLAAGFCKLAYYDLGVIAEARHFLPERNEASGLVMEVAGGKWQMEVDGNVVLEGNDPHPSPVFGLQELRFVNDCRIRGIRVLGEGPALSPRPRWQKAQKDFHLEVAVDFVDDLAEAPWTPSMFDRLFEEFQAWGVRRVQWFYYGRISEGWWPMGTQAGKNALETFRRSGEIFPAAIRAAHRRGMELYALLKPFDMGINRTLGQDGLEVENHGKLERIGGMAHWIADFPAMHREFIMARKPSAHGPSRQDEWTAIELVKEDSASPGFDMEDVRLFVSDDNLNYTPYKGPVLREQMIERRSIREHRPSEARLTEETREVRILRFSGLCIKSKFVALAIESRTGSFANDPVNLIRVFGEDGEDRMITLGVQPRAGRDFRTGGIEYDVCSPVSAVFPGYNPMRERFVFDSGHGVLAIAHGKDRGPLAALSPSFPEVRAWWLSWCRDALDAGADGLGLRVRNHHSPLTWAEFGFEQPVRDEFLERYGVDIWETDDFDKAALAAAEGGRLYKVCPRGCRAGCALSKAAGNPCESHAQYGARARLCHGNSLGLESLDGRGACGGRYLEGSVAGNPVCRGNSFPCPAPGDSHCVLSLCKWPLATGKR